MFICAGMLYMCMRLVMRVFFLCFHVSMGPLQFLSERSAVDRQSQGQFLALSPRFVCGIPGMCRNVGSDRWRGPPQRQTPRHNLLLLLPPPLPPLSLHQLVFPPQHYSLSFKFPLALRLKNECQETALRFFSLHMVSGEEMEADKLERKGWFNTRTRVQAFPFIFFLLAIFFLCLIDGVWTPLSAHIERYSHSSADGLSGCFRPLVPSSGSFNLPQQEVRCSKVFSPG